eukprot:1220952-Pleurochrysis_carterae.AAC.1
MRVCKLELAGPIELCLCSTISTLLQSFTVGTEWMGLQASLQSRERSATIETERHGTTADSLLTKSQRWMDTMKCAEQDDAEDQLLLSAS